MEIEKLISAFEETLISLRNSNSSDYSHLSVNETTEKLESELIKAQNSKSVDSKLLDFLFGPTEVLQDTAIDNGWGMNSCESQKLLTNLLLMANC